MFEMNLEQVRKNVQSATTEDLLDRATVYRTGMEPEALTLIEAELEFRGVTGAMIHDHAAKRGEVFRRTDGTAKKCHFCHRPAVGGGWRWHRLWGRIPVFPWLYVWCEEQASNERRV